MSFLDCTLSDLASLVASENYNLKLAFFVRGLLHPFDVPEIATAIASCALWLNRSTQKEQPCRRAGSLIDLQTLQRPTHNLKMRQICFRIGPDSDKVFAEWIRTIV